MATNVYDIKTKDWQLSKKGVGEIAENLDDIRQSIEFILFTAKGSLPLDPEFGTDIHLYIDQPLTVVVPNLTKEIITGIRKYETRVEIVSISAYNVVDHLFIKIKVKMIVNNSQKELIYDIDNYIRGKDTSETVGAYSNAYSTGYK